MAGEKTASSGATDLVDPATATATAQKKPRGRPLGSKNKPKPPVVVTRESEAAMRPVVLELAAGCDVVGAVAAFARRCRVGVSVLCGRGAVAAVTLRLAASSAAVTLHGRFEVLALSGTVVPSSASASASAPAFSVSLAGEGGQVIGGTLAGEMTAADGVVVVAAVFGSAQVHRLPAAGAEDEDSGGGREEGMRAQVAVGLGGTGTGGGLVVVGRQHAQQLPEVGLWGQQPTPAHVRGPVHALPRF
ncbi:AT-hook motif nuclear-localized protein 17 [Zea mays]|uniref:AT-hook motif nuclear-localized protein 17 n=1 Tax=Zea mays TaxID=4577 RepID=A0A3L6FAP1_MAIZE|nr:AT-hook motif nuclear-localized protein 17 [Zea mays]